MFRIKLGSFRNLGGYSARDARAGGLLREFRKFTQIKAGRRSPSVPLAENPAGLVTCHSSLLLKNVSAFFKQRAVYQMRGVNRKVVTTAIF